MLIINADDFGGNEAATDNSIDCYRQDLITSASAMVFMKDSRRAAEMAASAGLETGLHLNLTLAFDGPSLPCRLREHHSSIIGYFHTSKWSQVLYNPLLKNKMDYIFKAQYDEYYRLFNKEPAQIDGHHHKHLCANMIVNGIMPRGMRVRRNYTQEPGHKMSIMTLYRRLVDVWLVRRYRCADAFFSIQPMQLPGRLERIIRLACSLNVELMVHPAFPEQYEYLLSPQYHDLIGAVPKGSYRILSRAV
jgi:chitin disaccharide deacetylase